MLAGTGHLPTFKLVRGESQLDTSLLHCPCCVPLLLLLLLDQQALEDSLGVMLLALALVLAGAGHLPTFKLVRDAAHVLCGAPLSAVWALWPAAAAAGQPNLETCWAPLPEGSHPLVRRQRPPAHLRACAWCVACDPAPWLTVCACMLDTPTSGLRAERVRERGPCTALPILSQSSLRPNLAAGILTPVRECAALRRRPSPPGPVANSGAVFHGNHMMVGISLNFLFTSGDVHNSCRLIQLAC